MPGAAERILTQSEREQTHRFDTDNKIHQYNMLLIKNSHTQKMTGYVVGGILSLCIIAIGGVLVYNGHDIAGSTIITTTLVGLAGVFVVGKFKKQDS